MRFAITYQSSYNQSEDTKTSRKWYSSYVCPFVVCPEELLQRGGRDPLHWSPQLHLYLRRLCMTSLSWPHCISPSKVELVRKRLNVVSDLLMALRRRCDALNPSENLYNRRYPPSLFPSSQPRAASSTTPPPSMTSPLLTP